MRRILFSVVLLMFFFSLNGETNGKLNQLYSNKDVKTLGFNIGIGYSHLFETLAGFNHKGKCGFDIGLVYECKVSKNGGLWYAINPGFQLLSSSLSYSDIPDFDMRLTDTRGYEMTCHYSEFGSVKENHTFCFAYVGGQVGYHNGQGFYLCGGAKIMAGGLVSDVKTSYITSATYDEYIDDFEDMDNHYYKSHNVSKKNDNGLCIGGLLSFELGGQIKGDNKSWLRYTKIGAFVEGGVISMKLTESKQKSIGKVYGYYLPFEELSTNHDATELIPLSKYQTGDYSAHAIFPIYGGIRITFLFGQCPQCPPLKKKKRR
ncbi:MAG: hypothetical protein MJ001_02395 [Paludibacteraceae bacterium]|nr:hypothetical protein [Paludibacteraceae bacterium]